MGLPAPLAYLQAPISHASYWDH